MKDIVSQKSSKNIILNWMQFIRKLKIYDHHYCSILQSQKIASAYLYSKQLLFLTLHDRVVDYVLTEGEIVSCKEIAAKLWYRDTLVFSTTVSAARFHVD